ncbi:pilus assembly protein N-terminal domain-containing protein [Brevundimonas sp.]|uniref:pilus assembly protein N-terminal domain-containing protein n=1 Tax=Brevundimonas sp. TaxID=1871086 RepID=UPI002FD9460A
MKRTALILALAVTAVATTATAQSAPLNVEIDRSARIALRGAAASVIVGNPAIADVTVVDANTLYIVGKGYGVTEVVAVDAIGRPLFQNQVVVTGGSTGAVRMWRGGQMTEMACGGSCAPSIRSTGPGAAAPAVTPP